MMLFTKVANKLDGHLVRRRAPAEPLYIVTHERSGTHFLINTIANNFYISDEWANLGEWFGPYDQPERRFDHIDEFNQQFGEMTRTAKMIKSHCDRDLYEAKYQPRKVIYVFRDPRDTMVSFFHYLNNKYFYEYNPTVEDHRCESVSEFIRRPISPFLRHCYSLHGQMENVVERWAQHVKGWIDQEGVLVLRYVDIKNDLPGVLDRVHRHVGLRRRRRQKAVGLGDRSSILPRKGVIGDWQNSMTEQDSDFIRETVTRAGLDWDRVTVS